MTNAIIICYLRIYVLSTDLKMSYLSKRKKKELKCVTKSRNEKKGRITKGESVHLTPKYNQTADESQLDGCFHCIGKLYGLSDWWKNIAYRWFSGFVFLRFSLIDKSPWNYLLGYTKN